MVSRVAELVDATSVKNSHEYSPMNKDMQKTGDEAPTG